MRVMLIIVLLAIFVCLVLLFINQYTTADKVEKLYKIVGDLKEEQENNTIPSVGFEIDSLATEIKRIGFEIDGLATEIKRIDRRLDGVVRQIKRHQSRLK